MPEEICYDEKAVDEIRKGAYLAGYASASRKVRDYLAVCKTATKDSDDKMKKIVNEICVSMIEGLVIYLATEGAKEQ